MPGSLRRSAAGLAIDEVDGLPIWTFAEGEPILPGYLAWRRLGIGTRCETWLAWSTSMWCPVVVKVLRPHQTDHPRGIAAIAREGDALEAVRHPAWPRLWADGRRDALPHLVEEFIDGADLDHVLEESGALAQADLVQLGVQVGSALRALHSAGFAHLDLKPDNVAVRDARVTVLDLGSARPLGRSQPTGSPIGSAGYASPDLEAGADISRAMDVYGLGVLLAEAALDDRIFDSDLPPDQRPDVALPRSLPRALRGLIGRMLHQDPAERPDLDTVLATFAELADEDGEHLWPAAATRGLRAG